MTARVVLADDEPVFRLGLRAALHAPPLPVEVVGETDNLAHLRALAEELQPDLVITDSELGTDPVASAVCEITASTHVLVVSGDVSAATVINLLDSGARGYLDKRSSSEEAHCAARTVLAGGIALSRSTAARLTACVTKDPERAGRLAFPTLTDRELEVLDLIATGSSNRQIARTLVLSDKTIRNTVSNILTKLQADGRAQLIVDARRAGLGRAPATERGHSAPVLGVVIGA